MTEPACGRAMKHLMLDEPGAEAHLSACPACRGEADRLRALFGLLAGEAELPLPERLDAAIREAILRHPAPGRQAIRPAPALALAGAALAALAAGLALPLSATVAGAAGPAAAALLLIAYLTLSGAAALPILIAWGRRGAPVRARAS